MTETVGRLPRSAVVALTTFGLALPLFAALVELAQRRWYPVLDLAMTEFRVQDVGTRRTPLIGLPGRIGDLPEQGSHPGPLSFWALAPAYRLFGESAWALEVATVSVALVWIAAALWIGQRRLGSVGVAVIAAVIAVLIRGFGLSVLTQPWNPYMPLLAWLVVLLATWSVFCGDDLMLIPLAIAASFCAQTHIPYLTMAGSLGLVSFAVVALRQWRAEVRSARVLAITLGAFALLWIGPGVDQLRRSPGNVRQLIEYFTTPRPDAIGFRSGTRLMLRHLDVVDGYGRLLSGDQRFVQAGFSPDGAIWPGLFVLAAWLTAFAIALRLRHQPLIRLHAVLGVTLIATVLSTSRIFGQRWFYLTLWAWVTTTLIFVAIAWTAVAWIRSRDVAVGTRSLTLGAVTLATVATLSMVWLAPSTDHPEEYLGATLGRLLPDTEAALDPDGSYVVEWKDSYFFGSQGFGLVNELRRSGYDVGTSTFWRVPITNARTKPEGTAQQAIVLVTGNFVADWRADDRFTEVAVVDPRSPDELVEFDRLRTELIADLELTGLEDLIELVDTNLFGLNIDQRISPKTRELSARMIRLGQLTAVFLGPPGVGL